MADDLVGIASGMFSARTAYERAYCPHGDMENTIKKLSIATVTAMPQPQMGPASPLKADFLPAVHLAPGPKASDPRTRSDAPHQPGRPNDPHDVPSVHLATTAKPKPRHPTQLLGSQDTLAGSPQVRASSRTGEPAKTSSRCWIFR